MVLGNTKNFYTVHRGAISSRQNEMWSNAPGSSKTIRNLVKIVKGVEKMTASKNMAIEIRTASRTLT